MDVIAHNRAGIDLVIDVAVSQELRFQAGLGYLAQELSSPRRMLAWVMLQPCSPWLERDSIVLDDVRFEYQIRPV